MAFADGQSAGQITDSWGVVHITLAGTVVLGDALGYSSGWKRALATVGTAIQGELIALQNGVSGEVIQAAQGGVLKVRLSGMTPGGPLYVAEATSNGKYTETIPTTSGDVTTRCGTALTATEAMIYFGRAANTVV